jgi:hypothetical protein
MPQTRIVDFSLIHMLTLEMVCDAPDAFPETLSEAQARTDDEWRAFVHQLATQPTLHGLLAEDHDGLCGFVYADQDAVSRFSPFERRLC